MADTDRPYDLVVWGATGVAGRLVSEYLMGQHAPDELSLALGGRDPGRLDSLVAELVDRSREWGEVPTVVGDATDPDRLRDVARCTRVVCTTVGPYTTYGTPLVEACVAAGTDYCDLTGEVNWMRETVDRFHDDAVDAETRIVHGCGFDSVPADIGTALVQSFAADAFDIRSFTSDSTSVSRNRQSDVLSTHTRVEVVVSTRRRTSHRDCCLIDREKPY